MADSDLTQVGSVYTSLQGSTVHIAGNTSQYLDVLVWRSNSIPGGMSATAVNPQVQGRFRPPAKSRSHTECWAH